MNKTRLSEETRDTKVAATPSIAALRASYAVALSDAIAKQSFCPAFSRSDCTAGKTTDEEPRPEEIDVVRGRSS
jgi:hypothetical protein